MMRLPGALLLAALSLAVPAAAAEHPLDPLDAGEIRSAFLLVRAHFRDAANDLPRTQLRFPSLGLQEPAKSAVLAWREGDPLPRRARVEVMHFPSNRLWVAIVDVVAKRVDSLTQAAAGTQSAVSTEEFAAAAAIVLAHEPWRAAMRARGLDPDEVYLDVWAPGDVELPPGVALSHGAQTRLLQAIAFHRGGDPAQQDSANPHNPYDRPIEGVVVTLDMNARRVAHLVDSGVRPVSAESGNAAARRRTLRPLVVQQPRGSSAIVDGHEVAWQRWRFRASLHQREGLVLHDVRYVDGGRRRRIAYRIALSEIYVPYGEPDPNWTWRTAFDVGEYNLGLTAQTLEVDRDVPENTTFLDAVLASDTGPSDEEPTGAWEYPATIGIYERDAGILWSRTDPTTYERDTRFGRELVVTWNAWIGNYIYAFDYVFSMDGSLEVRIHLVGTTLNRGAERDGAHHDATAPTVGIDPHGALVLAPNHQHFFSFRLDLDVDGTANVVEQSDVGPVAGAGADNAFGAVHTSIDAEGFRDASSASARSWEVRSATRVNAFGDPTGYELHPGETAVPYSSPEFPALQRARFAQHAFWVTRYRDGELYAAGDHPSQGPVGRGLPEFVTPPEPLLNDGEDVVVWYTTGHTHVPRPEDFPVMPTATLHFELLPHGFFDRNPALDAPDQGAGSVGAAEDIAEAVELGET